MLIEMVLTFFIVALAGESSMEYWQIPDDGTALMSISFYLCLWIISAFCLVKGVAMPFIGLLLGRSLWGIMAGTVSLNRMKV